MTRHPYSAGAVKYAFWFAEFRQEVELLLAGRSFAEIEALAREANLFGTRTPARSRTIYITVTRRIRALGPDFYDLFMAADLAGQKTLALAAIMADDTLFFDFVYEVVREKILMGTNAFTDADIRIFFRNKQVQDETAAKWTDATIKKLCVVYKQYLMNAGITDNGRNERKILKPILDPSLERWLSDHEMAVIVKALTGEA